MNEILIKIHAVVHIVRVVEGEHVAVGDAHPGIRTVRPLEVHRQGVVLTSFHVVVPYHVQSQIEAVFHIDRLGTRRVRIVIVCTSQHDTSAASQAASGSFGRTVLIRFGRSRPAAFQVLGQVERETAGGGGRQVDCGCRSQIGRSRMRRVRYGDKSCPVRFR